MNLELIEPFKKPNAFKLQDKKSGAFIIGEKTDKPDGVEIPAIYVPVPIRNKGIGTALLEEMIKTIEGKYPDWPIFLTAMPMLDCPLNFGQLIAWYQKQDFIPIKGDHESMIMVYDPDKEIEKWLEEQKQ